MLNRPLSRADQVNLLLLIAIVVLSLLAWYQPGLQKIHTYLLSALKKETIHHIVIEHASLATIKLSRVNQYWRMDAPYQLPANHLRVETILALASARSYSQFKVAEADLKTYQLDKPLISVQLNEYSFMLGSTDPINKQRYVMMNSDTLSNTQTVHLINGVIYYQLRAALHTFISPSLLPPQSKINSIHWANKTVTIDNNQLQLTPENAQVSSDSMVQLLQNWQKIQASKVELKPSFTIDNDALLKDNSIIIHYTQNNDKGEALLKTITYVIIQEGSQLKLLRTDLNIAYWISSQQLHYLTQLLPIKHT